MDERLILHRHVYSLPELLSLQVDALANGAAEVTDRLAPSQLRQVLLTGCGDSHHAALATALAFQRLAGLQSQAMTAMQFARYNVGGIPRSVAAETLVIGTSASGQVSRTVEALRLAGEAGCTTVAVTGALDCPLGQAAVHVLEAPTPPLEGDAGQGVPGARSYLTSLVALLLLAIALGRSRRSLAKAAADKSLEALTRLPEALAETMRTIDPLLGEAAEKWHDASHFSFCGSGPNYGTALFGAAKILEASGEVAIGRDLEEWAHLDYFGRRADTPTLFLSAGDWAWDADRQREVLTAAETIGRRVAVVAPADSQILAWSRTALALPFTAQVEEWLSPLLTCVAPLLLASHRAERTGEPYFRAFSGGRSIEGGGGISRIRTSQQIDRPRR
jgi:glutamine---fructose-6-phosphate transaminase (isomerizing)